MTKDLIGCKSPADYKSLANYASFVTQKVAAKKMICLIIKEFTLCMNIIEELVILGEEFEFY